MTSALVKLREVVRQRRTSWVVEMHCGCAVVHSHAFGDRPAARRFAKDLASEHDVVIVLAGPAAPVAKRLAPVRDAGR